LDVILEQLLEIDRAMIAALDGGDVDLFQQLVSDRGTLIADLRVQFDAATDEERRTAGPRFQLLAERDESLQVRATAARDQLGRRLTESTHGGGHAQVPAASGVFDRRA